MAARMATSSLLRPFINHHHCRLLSSFPATRYPLYYELIVSRPPPRRALARSRPPPSDPTPLASDDAPFESWIDRKISDREMDKKMRKYYNKRRKRIFGSDSDSDSGAGGKREKYIELKPEVVEMPSYHAREEELYFYDAFAMPWEKDKHYRMVYQLEKKYFPDQCLDKAFVDPSQATKKAGNKVEDDGDRRLLFFEGEGEKKVDWVGKGEDVGVEEVVEEEMKKKGTGGVGITERKVEEFFKSLKTAPSDKKADREPFLASKRTGLPPTWDGPSGTVVLVNKPKGLRYVFFM